MLDIRQLACFTAAYRYKSISKAAESMFISQQAVSHSIREMENALGGPLFERFSGGVTPTPLGEALYPDAEKLLIKCAAFEEKAAFIVKNSAAISLAYANGIFNVEDAANLDTLCAYVKDELHTSLTLMERTTDECAAMLESGRVDMLCVFNPQGFENCRVEKLRAYPLYVGLAPNHPLARKEPLTFADLQQYPTIGDPRDDRLNKMMSSLSPGEIGLSEYFPSAQLSAFAEIMRRDNSLLMFTLPFLHTYAGADAAIRPSPIKGAVMELSLVYRKNHPDKAKLAKIAGWLKNWYK